MGNLATKAAGAKLQKKPDEQLDFGRLLKGQWSKISAVVPKHMSQERLYQLAISAYNSTPGLAECSPVSVLSCVMKCAALGMEPSAVDGLGRAYILPFYSKKTRRKEATFILGYKGMLDLSRRSGEVMSISARPVYDGDEFEFAYGLDERLVHVPANVDHSNDRLTHVYCVAKFKDGGSYIDVMTRKEIDSVRQRSKSPDDGPWVTDFEAMACKSVVRRAFKFFPVSVESQSGAASDETTPALPELDFAGAPAIETEAVDVEEATPEPVPAEAERPRKAVCRSCGNVVENILPDALPEDVKFQCCDTPEYEIKQKI